MILRTLNILARNRMANPLRNKLKTSDDKVLPFCYELALGRQLQQLQQLSLSTQANSEPEQQAKPTSTQSLEGNPYYSKYAEKIRKAQAEKEASAKASTTADAASALKTASEEPSKVTSKATTTTAQSQEPETKSDKANKETPSKAASVEKESSSKTTTTTTTTEAPSKAKPQERKLRKQLNDIVKVDLLAEKSAEEITAIWNAYHAKRDGIYATIPAATYQRLFETATKYPAFILPLPRNSCTSTSSSSSTSSTSSENNSDQPVGGYEFFLLQFEEHSVHFTPMAAYHLHRELAPVCLTLHHYPELSASKGLVLLNAEFDSNLLNALECQCLANQLQHYYTTEDAAPRLSLHLFNRQPKGFDHMRLIAHLEAGMQAAGPLGSVNLERQD
ncbi:ATP synthase mitochondrial F1 complex assembly factor 1 [Tyrophagus putrescentiae]|nr:ATP synthase mitochondrial F1 complex assembly factor 1 [Tyrophagus putrescentiae]